MTVFIASIVLAGAIFLLLWGCVDVLKSVINIIKFEKADILDGSYFLLSSILFGIFYFLTH
jgi:hypothetical protein